MKAVGTLEGQASRKVHRRPVSKFGVVGKKRRQSIVAYRQKHDIGDRQRLLGRHALATMPAKKWLGFEL